VDKGIQGSAYAARETHKNVGIAKVVAAEISGAPRVAACRASHLMHACTQPPPPLLTGNAMCERVRERHIRVMCCV